MIINYIGMFEKVAGAPNEEAIWADYATRQMPRERIYQRKRRFTGIDSQHRGELRFPQTTITPEGKIQGNVHVNYGLSGARSTELSRKRRAREAVAIKLSRPGELAKIEPKRKTALTSDHGIDDVMEKLRFDIAALHKQPNNNSSKVKHITLADYNDRRRANKASARATQMRNISKDLKYGLYNIKDNVRYAAMGKDGTPKIPGNVHVKYKNYKPERIIANPALNKPKHIRLAEKGYGRFIPATARKFGESADNMYDRIIKHDLGHIPKPGLINKMKTTMKTEWLTNPNFRAEVGGFIGGAIAHLPQLFQ